MRAIAGVCIALGLVVSAIDGQPRCRKGIPCGNSCISASKTCRIDGSTSTPSRPPSVQSLLDPTSGARAPDSSQYVVGSKRTRLFVPWGCAFGARIPPDERIVLASAAVAKAVNYLPAPDSVCRQQGAVPEVATLRREVDSLRRALEASGASDKKAWAAHPEGFYYYRSTCRAAQELPGRIYFATEQEARASGRTPSQVPGCS